MCVAWRVPTISNRCINAGKLSTHLTPVSNRTWEWTDPIMHTTPWRKFTTQTGEEVVVICSLAKLAEIMFQPRAG